jgi:hypothetical protein
VDRIPGNVEASPAKPGILPNEMVSNDTDAIHPFPLHRHVLSARADGLDSDPLAAYARSVFAQPFTFTG